MRKYLATFLALQCVGAEGFVNNLKRFDARAAFISLR
jgi:hypothetical protein